MEITILRNMELPKLPEDALENICSEAGCLDLDCKCCPFDNLELYEIFREKVNNG